MVESLLLLKQLAEVKVILHLFIVGFIAAVEHIGTVLKFIDVRHEWVSLVGKLQLVS